MTRTPGAGFGDDEGDMNEPVTSRSSSQLDRLLDDESDGTELAQVVAAMRSIPGRTAATVPNRELTEFVSAPRRSGAVATPRRGKQMYATLLTAVGTTAGKVVLGTTIAAAAVTGAVATDIVDLPSNDDKTEIVLTDQPESDNNNSTTSEPSPSTSATAPADSSSTSTSTSVAASTVAVAPTSSSGASSSTSTTTSTIASTSTTNTSSSTTTPSTTNVSSIPDHSAVTIAAVDAGSVTVSVRNGRLVLEGFSTATGWTVTNESLANDIDLSFRRGEDDRVDVDVEVENGRVRVRVRDRRTDIRTETDLDGRPFG